MAGPSDDENPFKTLADLFHATEPQTNAEMALIAAYWIQVYSGQEQFSSQNVNKHIQELGHNIKNITAAFSRLQRQKPALALQVRKSGKSPQARKSYKLTTAGIEAVRAKFAKTHG
jgi:hypothetical protein